MGEEHFQERIIQKLIDQQPTWQDILAKNIVASGASRKCLIQLSYAIGVSEPISIFVQIDKEKNSKVQKLIDIIKSNFDLTPFGIKSFLKLDRPIYAETASYGHFGREYNESKGTFTWESLSSLDLFKKIFNAKFLWKKTS